MSEITRKRTGELQRKIFEVLLAHPEGLKSTVVLADVERELELTAFEKSDYPNRPGVRRFERIARFSTIAPVKADWLVKEKGKWRLTDPGPNLGSDVEVAEPGTHCESHTLLVRKVKTRRQPDYTVCPKCAQAVSDPHPRARNANQMKGPKPSKNIRISAALITDWRFSGLVRFVYQKPSAFAPFIWPQNAERFLCGVAARRRRGEAH